VQVPVGDGVDCRVQTSTLALRRADRTNPDPRRRLDTGQHGDIRRMALATDSLDAGG